MGKAKAVYSEAAGSGPLSPASGQRLGVEKLHSRDKEGSRRTPKGGCSPGKPRAANEKQGVLGEGGEVRIWLSLVDQA